MMADQKKLRMDEAGARLVRIMRDLRALQDQLHNKRLGELIEELASAITLVLSWRALVEMNGGKLPGDEDE